MTTPACIPLMVTATLEWRVAWSGESVDVALFGALTESANLSTLAKEIASASFVRFDLGGITRINSVGLREWLHLLREIRSVKDIELWECSPAFVAQLNMISNLADGAIVKSVQLPYCCDTCQEVCLVSGAIEEGRPPPVITPPTCPRDGTQMVFDDIPELYFGFLTGVG